MFRKQSSQAGSLPFSYCLLVSVTGGLQTSAAGAGGGGTVNFLSLQWQQTLKHVQLPKQPATPLLHLP